jgi:hypothetical protein
MKTAMEAQVKVFDFFTLCNDVNGLLTNWFYDHRSSSIQFRDHGSYTECSFHVSAISLPIAAAIIFGSQTELPLK